MQAFVYKSLKKADTYVYLAAREDFARLPDALRARLAPFAFVLELALTPDAGSRVAMRRPCASSWCCAASTCNCPRAASPTP